jgi:hypothetical protein
VKLLWPCHLVENTLEESPDYSPGAQPHVPQLFKASSNASIAEERGLEDPAGLTKNNSLHIALYTPKSGRPYLSNRPGVETPDYPYPRIGVIILRGRYASTQAHLYAQVQHIVVDLEEPRTLRPTIGWPASGPCGILHTNFGESPFHALW